ncbi:MAG: hypothetical protein ACPGU7_12995 [Gammaproteobacteria bacterium]
MPFDALLLIALGGYAFLSLAPRFRYRTARLDRTRLLLWSIGTGLILSLGARLIVLAANACCPALGLAWKEQIPMPYYGTAACTMLLGLCLGWASRAMTRDEESRDYADAAFDGNNAYFEKLVLRAQGRRQIMVTTRSRKVYIGFVHDSISPDSETQSIQMLPMFSGYRREQDQGLELTTFYGEVYARLAESPEEGQASEFSLVLPMAVIESAALFDPDVFAMFDGPEPTERITTGHDSDDAHPREAEEGEMWETVKTD